MSFVALMFFEEYSQAPTPHLLKTFNGTFLILCLPLPHDSVELHLHLLIIEVVLFYVKEY